VERCFKEIQQKTDIHYNKNNNINCITELGCYEFRNGILKQLIINKYTVVSHYNNYNYEEQVNLFNKLRLNCRVYIGILYFFVIVMGFFRARNT